MTTPPSHLSNRAAVSQTQGSQQQQQGQQQGQQPTQERNDRPLHEGRHRPQQQADFASGPAEQRLQRERQQHLVDAEDDPASDANTASANHPNDE